MFISGHRFNDAATSEKATPPLGWTPRSREDSIIATIESLVQLGLLKDSGKKAA